MNPQFKFEKQSINPDTFMRVKPEQLIMLNIQQSMKNLKLRSFPSYLKWAETTRIQRVSIMIIEISDILNISFKEAEILACEWMNNIGGQLVQHAGINAYYFKGVYEIIA